MLSAPIYLVLRLPYTVSPIPTPCPLAASDRTRILGLITTIRAPLTTPKHRPFRSGTSGPCHSETGHPDLWLPGFVNQGRLFRPIPFRVPQFQVSFHEMFWTHEVDLPDPSSPDPIDRTYAPLARAPLDRASLTRTLLHDLPT